jgi:iron donor protein CyaY
MPEPLSESEFRLAADDALESLERTLASFGDDHDVEVDLQNGVMQVEFGAPSPAKFVVSPNAPVRQIWVSALSRSYKLSWAPATGRFELAGESLDALLTRLVHQNLGITS